MSRYRLFIDFEDPEPGDTASDAVLQALGQRGDKIANELSNGHPFRFGTVGIDRLGDEDGSEDSPEPAQEMQEVTRYHVSILHDNGEGGSTRYSKDGVHWTEYEASGTVVVIRESDARATRIPVCHVLEWTEVQYRTHVPVQP